MSPTLTGGGNTEHTRFVCIRFVVALVALGDTGGKRKDHPLTTRSRADPDDFWQPAAGRGSNVCAFFFFFEALGSVYTVRPHIKKVGKAIRAALGPSAQAVKMVAEEESEG